MERAKTLVGLGANVVGGVNVVSWGFSIFIVWWNDRVFNVVFGHDRHKFLGNNSHAEFPT